VAGKCRFLLGRSGFSPVPRLTCGSIVIPGFGHELMSESESVWLSELPEGKMRKTSERNLVNGHMVRYLCLVGASYRRTLLHVISRNCIPLKF
jgi:hypothetical protein